MKIEINETNEENIRRLSLIFNIAMNNISNYILNAGLKAIESDLKAGIPEKIINEIKSEVSKLKKKY